MPFCNGDMGPRHQLKFSRGVRPGETRDVLPGYPGAADRADKRLGMLLLQPDIDRPFQRQEEATC